MTSDQIRHYCVAVENGSGIIFQPQDISSTYILTAKHVLTTEGEQPTNRIGITRFVLNGADWTEIPMAIENPVQQVDYFLHENKDIAIIKIPRIDGFTAAFRKEKDDNDTAGYTLAGYPHVRRGREIAGRFRQDNGITLYGTGVGGSTEAGMANHERYGEIIGLSGGPILKDAGERILIAGIQNRIVGAPGEELSRIEFTPIHYFNEIVDRYPENLTELIPSYLSCFSFLEDGAFDLEVEAFDEENIIFVRNLLREKAQEVVGSQITPKFIKDQFGTSLIIEDGKAEILQQKAIWVAWLELLTILNIAKENVHSPDDLKTIFNNYRLFYSSTTRDWSYELQNLIYADYQKLEDNGIVIVKTSQRPLRTFEFPKNKIIRTDRAVDKSRMRTNNGIKFPFDQYRFIHASAFDYQCIVEKLEEYVAIGDNEVELMNKLKNEYNQLFGR